jgi:hypothetical protein
MPGLGRNGALRAGSDYCCYSWPDGVGDGGQSVMEAGGAPLMPCVAINRYHKM